MKRIFDFVFIYEVKNRELESVILLKCELERRGYSVGLVETWENELSINKRLNARVVISFALYNDDTIKYMFNFVNNCNLFVNMQWEQIFTNGDNLSIDFSQSNGVYGKAKECIHICWGENTFHRLSERYEIRDSNLNITGNIKLDFFRKEFSTLYYTKHDLLNKYNINGFNRIYLFISSFSYVSLPDNIINSDLYQNQGFDVKKQCIISEKSRNIILEWFKIELNKHKDVLIIYRPHPAEADSIELIEMEKKYSNFRCINELSINQWIIVSDKIYTWWSSSVAEVYAANKGCDILRPIEIPYENELEIYKDIESINSFEIFDSTYLNESRFPISSKVMDWFYNIDTSEAVYIKICNLLENVIKSNKPYMETNDIISHQFFNRIYRIICIILKNILFGNEIFYSLLNRIFKKLKFLSFLSIEEKKTEYDYFVEMRRKNHTSLKEINELEDKLKNILYEI